MKQHKKKYDRIKAAAENTSVRMETQEQEQAYIESHIAMVNDKINTLDADYLKNMNELLDRSSTITKYFTELGLDPNSKAIEELNKSKNTPPERPTPGGTTPPGGPGGTTPPGGPGGTTPPGGPGGTTPPGGPGGTTPPGGPGGTTPPGGPGGTTPPGGPGGTTPPGGTKSPTRSSAEEEELDDDVAVRIESVKVDGKKYTVQFEARQGKVYGDKDIEEFKRPNALRRLFNKARAVTHGRRYGLKFTDAVRAAHRADGSILSIINRQMRWDPSLEVSRARYLKYLAGKDPSCFDIKYEDNKRMTKRLNRGHDKLLRLEEAELRTFEEERVIYPEMEEEFHPEYELTDEEALNLTPEQISKRLDEITAAHEAKMKQDEATRQQNIDKAKETVHKLEQKRYDHMFGPGFDQHDNPPQPKAAPQPAPQPQPEQEQDSGKRAQHLYVPSRNLFARARHFGGKLFGNIRSTKLFGGREGKFSKPRTVYTDYGKPEGYTDIGPEEATMNDSDDLSL